MDLPHNHAKNVLLNVQSVLVLYQVNVQNVQKLYFLIRGHVWTVQGIGKISLLRKEFVKRNVERGEKCLGKLNVMMGIWLKVMGVMRNVKSRKIENAL